MTEQNKVTEEEIIQQVDDVVEDGKESSHKTKLLETKKISRNGIDFNLQKFQMKTNKNWVLDINKDNVKNLVKWIGSDEEAADVLHSALGHQFKIWLHGGKKKIGFEARNKAFLARFNGRMMGGRGGDGLRAELDQKHSQIESLKELLRMKIKTDNPKMSDEDIKAEIELALENMK